MFADAQTLAGSILTTDQNGQTETVIYTYPEQIQQFQLTWIKSWIMPSWRIDLVCWEAKVSYVHVKLFYLCFFISWLRQSFFTSIVHSGMRIACCYWFSIELIIRTLIYSLQSIKARLLCIIMVSILAKFFFYVEFLLIGGTTITLWILAIMIEKSVINILMSYRQTLIVSPLLCTENLLCEFNNSIWKPHFQNQLLCELTHCILTQIVISLYQ